MTRIWISGIGRSGTTAITKLFIELGYTTSKGDGNPYEYEALSQLNDEIIKDLYEDGYPGQKKVARYDPINETMILDWPLNPMPDNWFRWLNLDRRVEGRWKGQIQEMVKDLPEVAKDPRWSITLPLWFRCLDGKDHPDLFICCIRDPYQSAMSWISKVGPPKAWEDPVASAKRRIGNLCTITQEMKDRGIHVLYLQYPDMFEGLEGMSKYLEGCIEKPWKEILEAAEKVIDTSQVKNYSEKKKGQQT